MTREGHSAFLSILHFCVRHKDGTPTKKLCFLYASPALDTRRCDRSRLIFENYGEKWSVSGRDTAVVVCPFVHDAKSFCRTTELVQRAFRLKEILCRLCGSSNRFVVQNAVKKYRSKRSTIFNAYYQRNLEGEALGL